jgi:hypothetical protein
LQELFDTKIKLNVTTSNASSFSAFFYVPAEDGNLFEFQFSATKVGEEFPWEIIFLRIISQSKPGDKQALDVFNDMTAKETLATFSGVKKALLLWYNSQKPDAFAFTAKSTEGSRVKLYKKFAKLIAKKLKLNMISGAAGSNERFVFSKKG